MSIDPKSLKFDFDICVKMAETPPHKIYLTNTAVNDEQSNIEAIRSSMQQHLRDGMLKPGQLITLGQFSHSLLRTLLKTRNNPVKDPEVMEIASYVDFLIRNSFRMWDNMIRANRDMPLTGHIVVIPQVYDDLGVPSPPISVFP